MPPGNRAWEHDSATTALHVGQSAAAPLLVPPTRSPDGLPVPLRGALRAGVTTCFDGAVPHTPRPLRGRLVPPLGVKLRPNFGWAALDGLFESARTLRGRCALGRCQSASLSDALASSSVLFALRRIARFLWSGGAMASASPSCHRTYEIACRQASYAWVRRTYARLR